MAFHYRIGAAVLIALSVYGGSGVASPRWIPIGGSDLAQVGVVFGIAFIIGEVTEIILEAWRSRRHKPKLRQADPKSKKAASKHRKPPR